MDSPYNFKPTQISPVTLPESAPSSSQGPAIPDRAATKIVRSNNTDRAFANLRQAAATAIRNEIPVDQSDMRGW